MKSFGKLAFGALMLAGTAAGTMVATTAPAAAAHVSVGIGIGVPGPGYYRPGYYRAGVDPRCGSPHFRWDHPGYCPAYAPGYRQYYGPNYYGYYDEGYYGPGYYEPVVGGFWFTDNFGHRRWRGGHFDGRGFHGHAAWHGGGGHGGYHGGHHNH